MADMVPVSIGGNTSSQVREEWRVLGRTSRGRYCLALEKRTNGESFEGNSHSTKRNAQSPPSVQPNLPLHGKVSLGSFTNGKFWVPGNPAPFATRGEKPWKETLLKNLPQRSSEIGERGLVLDFQLSDLAPLGHPLDVDNLCEPVFSILINRKGWFGGNRGNMHWWCASKKQGLPSGSRIEIFSNSPSAKLGQNIVFDKYWPGPPPRSARSPYMPAWIREVFHQREAHPDNFYFVRLAFDDANLNIGDISTGVAKPTIDCLYPVIGGTAGSPEDWRISVLQVEKRRNYDERKGVQITIGRVL